MARISKPNEFKIKENKQGTYIVDVSPNVAAEWLGFNKDVNRPINVLRVTKFAQAMSRGQWKLDGNSVKFDWNGVLIDGQHRLLACIKSECTFRVVVVTGLDPDAFFTQDKGQPRSLRQQLNSVFQVKNSSTMASYLKTGAELVAGCKVLIDTADEYEDWERVLPGLSWAIETLVSDPITRRAAVGGVLAFAYRKNPEVIQLFSEEVISGAGLEQGDPALVLRNWLMRNSMKSQTQGGARHEAIIARVLRCARAACEGQKLERIYKRDSDFEWFRSAYNTPAVRKLVAPWQGAKKERMLQLNERQKALSAENKRLKERGKPRLRKAAKQAK